MRRLTPRPPRLSFLHRRLARLPLGAPTGFACAAAGVACVVGLIFVGPRVGILLGFPHDGSVRQPTVAGATNAPAPTQRPKAARVHPRKITAPGGGAAKPMSPAADDGARIGDPPVRQDATPPPHTAPESTPAPTMTPAPDDDARDDDDSPSASGGRDDGDPDDRAGSSHDSDDDGDGDGHDERGDERTGDRDGAAGSGSDEEPPGHGDDAGDSA